MFLAVSSEVCGGIDESRLLMYTFALYFVERKPITSFKLAYLWGRKAVILRRIEISF